MFFSLFKTTNILPFNIWHLNVSLTKRSRVDIAHGEFEMVLSNRHSFKNLSINFFSLPDNFLPNLTKWKKGFDICIECISFFKHDYESFQKSLYAKKKSGGNFLKLQSNFGDLEALEMEMKRKIVLISH